MLAASGALGKQLGNSYSPVLLLLKPLPSPPCLLLCCSANVSPPSLAADMLCGAFNVIAFSWIASPAATELEAVSWEEFDCQEFACAACDASGACG